MEFNLGQRLPTCLVDPAHPELALLNVLINACGTIAPRGGTITVSTALARPPARGRSRLWLRHTGQHG